MTTVHYHAAQRNMRLAMALLETVPEQALTHREVEVLHSLVLSARLLTSSILARPVQETDCTATNRKQ